MDLFIISIHGKNDMYRLIASVSNYQKRWERPVVIILFKYTKIFQSRKDIIDSKIPLSHPLNHMVFPEQRIAF